MMWQKRDARSRQRVLECKAFLLELKEKIKEGNAILPDDLRKNFEHQIKVVEQI